MKDHVFEPIIIVTGPPQSYTSLVSKFLHDNGGYSNDQMGEANKILPYQRFESKNLETFVKTREKFRDADLTTFFNQLPKDKVITLKLPFILQFINELDQYTDREIKIVYCLRNPQDIILSSMKKSKKSFIYFFERIVWYHHYLGNCKFNTHILSTEQLLTKNKFAAENLLDFCHLNSSQPNFSCLDSKKIFKREPSYLRYRFANFIWKRLSFLFGVYKVNR